jgi:hypothetical protein
MTTRLPILQGQEGGPKIIRVDQRARLLIVCPLADIYSG